MKTATASGAGNTVAVSYVAVGQQRQSLRGKQMQIAINVLVSFIAVLLLVVFFTSALMPFAMLALALFG